MALDPRIVQGAGAAFAAGPLLHDAVGDLERALHGIHGVAQRYLFGRSSEAGTSPPSLAGLHKTGAGELRHHAGEQTARHHGLFGDPVGGHQLAAPRIEREVNQYPQRVTPLAREFKLHWSLLSFLPGLWPFVSERGRVLSSPQSTKRGDRGAYPTDHYDSG